MLGMSRTWGDLEEWRSMLSSMAKMSEKVLGNFSLYFYGLKVFVDTSKMLKDTYNYLLFYFVNMFIR